MPNSRERPRPCSVLLISWYFPPDNTIASVRVGKMADFLEGTGHAIRVVTPDTKSDNPSLAVELDTRAIERTRCFDLEACFNPAGRPHADLSTLNAQTPYFQLSLRRAKRAFESFYRNLILYPDKRVDWCLTLAPTVDRLIRNRAPGCHLGKRSTLFRISCRRLCRLAASHSLDRGIPGPLGERYLYD